MSEKANEPQPQHQVVWGASAIGKVVGLSRPQTFRMLEAGLLPGKKFGRLWQSTVEALRAATMPDAK